MSQNKLPSLPFDQYSRQTIVKELINSVNKSDKLKILDVGGNNGNTHLFFPDSDITIVDLYDKTEPGYVKASALDLPFSDSSYDYVVSFDVFEHINKTDREQFVNELTRVASNGVVIAAPFNTPGVHEAELEMNTLYKELNGKDHPWLIEHIDNGLPEIETLEKQLANKKLFFKSFDSNSLMLWKLWQGLYFAADAMQSPELMTKANDYYALNYWSIEDGSDNSYRKIYFITKNNQTLLTLPYNNSVNARLTFYSIITQCIVYISTKNHRLKLSEYSKNELEIHSNKLFNELNSHRAKINKLEKELLLIRSSKIWKLVNASEKIKRALGK